MRREEKRREEKEINIIVFLHIVKKKK